MTARPFKVWIFGDAHVGTDLKKGRQSLAEALQTSETGGAHGGPAFDWDIAIEIGDLSGGQAVPQDSEGEEVVRQFSVLQNHPREAIYNICGNHDRSGLQEPPAWWWQKWVDPLGENTAFSRVNHTRRPYPVTGTWERYSFQTGNILFLMLSDINEPSQSLGRGDLGGNPGGVVSGETFAWWQKMVQEHPDEIIISAHHYMLKETTVASGPWEGMNKDANGNWCSGFHGYKPLGTPQGASFLYFVDSKPDSGAFEHFLSEHPGAVDLWLGGHTHAGPDTVIRGRSHVESKWGTHFINAAALTRHHGVINHPNPPKSRLLTFTEGSPEVRVQCYIHSNEFFPQGWYQPAERTLRLSKPFRLAL